jgi:hypothetical protein
MELTEQMVLMEQQVQPVLMAHKVYKAQSVQQV